MSTANASQARTHLARPLRAVEASEAVTITRHGRPVAQLALAKTRKEEVAEVFERFKQLREQRRRKKDPPVTIEEILAWRHEEHKHECGRTTDGARPGVASRPEPGDRRSGGHVVSGRKPDVDRRPPANRNRP